MAHAATKVAQTVPQNLGRNVSVAFVETNPYDFVLLTINAEMCAHNS